MGFRVAEFDKGDRDRGNAEQRGGRRFEVKQRRSSEDFS